MSWGLFAQVALPMFWGAVLLVAALSTLAKNRGP